MSGVYIAVPCGSHARYSKFWATLQTLERPAGSKVGIEIGPFIVNNQNRLGKKFLASKCDYFFLANDDNVYESDTITQLLSHQKEAVVGFCVTRRPPHFPLLYGMESDGKFKALTLTTETGLIRIKGCGGGSLLLHRDVFEKVAFPWWEVKPQADGNHGGEDLAFCRKLIDHNIPLYADLDVQVGHIMEFTLTPKMRDGVWQISMDRH